MIDMLTILQGDCLEKLREVEPGSVQCCVTSPPYWGLRDYGCAGQIGLEKSPDEYVAKMVAVFAGVRKALADDGTLWLNLGDSYSSSGERKTGRNDEGPITNRAGGSVRGGLKHRFGAASGCKPKDLIGIPWMVAFALRADGWYLRCDVIWHKPNPMPESVTDRPTKAHEYLFLLSKSPRYYYDYEAIKEPAIGWNGSRFDDPRDLAIRPNTGRKPRRQGFTSRRAEGGMGIGATGNEGKPYEEQSFRSEDRNKRSVWTVPPANYRDAHFATFPPGLIKPCILAGSKPGDTILDPFFGSGTTGEVALELGRKCIGVELNPKYVELAEKRCAGTTIGLPI